MNALAFSNNDIAVIAWTYDRRLKGCLGFALYRIDVQAGTEELLPALARFKDTPVGDKLTTAQAPVQKFWWKDLYAKRGRLYKYRIVPMRGKPGALKPMSTIEPLVTNTVWITHDRGLFKVFFNRGIVSTQAISRAVPNPNAAKLLEHVKNTDDSVRRRLMGELYQGLTHLLERSVKDGSELHGALYELNDPDGLELELQGTTSGADVSRRHIILGNERTDSSDDADADNRQNLKASGVHVIDRILGDQHIPHNKFMVIGSADDPQAVLTGSTNWTSTGLATQANNALVVESPAVAKSFMAYWQQLQADIDAAAGDTKQLQSQELRTWARNQNKKRIQTPIQLEDGSATIETHFSPNTKKTSSTSSKEVPVDMARLYELVRNAKQAVLFLAFDPGNNSILDAAGLALKNNPKLFVRGALTSKVRASNFKEALQPDSLSPPDTGMEVAVVGEPGGTDKKKTPEPDYRAIPAEQITASDAFGAWEAELYKVGFAIIHDKIVVIDPFSNDSVVILGSHNLGYRASHNNDENMLIVHGHRPLAEAYACHVLDIYDHYAWRYWLKRFPDIFGKPLDDTDSWQDRYLSAGKAKSPELRFWLSARPSAAIQ